MSATLAGAGEVMAAQLTVDLHIVAHLIQLVFYSANASAHSSLNSSRCRRCCSLTGAARRSPLAAHTCTALVHFLFASQSEIQ